MQLAEEGGGRKGAGSLGYHLLQMVIFQATSDITSNLHLSLTLFLSVRSMRYSNDNNITRGRKQKCIRGTCDDFLPDNFNSVNSEALCTRQVVELEGRLDDTEIEQGKNSSPRVTGVSSVSLSAFSWGWTWTPSSSGVSTLLIVLRTV